MDYISDNYYIELKFTNAVLEMMKITKKTVITGGEYPNLEGLLDAYLGIKIMPAIASRQLLMKVTHHWCLSCGRQAGAH